MGVELSLTSFIIALVVLIPVSVVPVRIGASLLKVENKSYKNCCIAVVAGTLLASASMVIIGGVWGVLLAYAFVAFVYSKIFSFSVGLGFTFALSVFAIQFGLLQGLDKLGLLI